MVEMKEINIEINKNWIENKVSSEWEESYVFICLLDF